MSFILKMSGYTIFSFMRIPLVALMSTGKDEKGYYQELTYHEIDAEDLAVKPVRPLRAAGQHRYRKSRG